MGGPAWLSGTFAAVMLTVAVYCAGRLVVARLRRRPTELDTDAAHITMGVAMAGMLVPGLRVLPAGLWEAVFVAGAAWFGGQSLRARRAAASSAWRCPHPAPHIVECAAMLYMFLALPAAAGLRAPTGAMSASAAGSRFSYLPLLLALFLLGYVVRQGDRITAQAGPGSGAAPGSTHHALAPRCAALCKIAMGLTMGYMLILML